MTARTGRRPARPATCRRAPTWSSIAGTITAFASRGPISRQSSARRTPATTATPTRSPQWAAAAIERWFGADRKGFQTYADASMPRVADRKPMPRRCSPPLRPIADAPAFARASALAELRRTFRRRTSTWRGAGFADPDPMVRIGALDMLETSPPAQIWPLVSPLLTDPVRGVRIRAAALLAAVPTASQPPADRERFERAAAEFIAAQRAQCRPAGSALGAGKLSMPGAAVPPKPKRNTRRRCASARNIAPAAINLADLYRQLHRDGDGESVLRTAIASSPADAGLHYALGLTLTRLESGQTKRSTNCAAPPSCNPNAPDMPTSLRWPCTRQDIRTKP